MEASPGLRGRSSQLRLHRKILSHQTDYQCFSGHWPLRLTSQLPAPHDGLLVTVPGMLPRSPVPLSQIHPTDLAEAGFREGLQRHGLATCGVCVCVFVCAPQPAHSSITNVTACSQTNTTNRGQAEHEARLEMRGESSADDKFRQEIQRAGGTLQHPPWT